MTTHPTTDPREAEQEREASINWLRMRIISGRAGLDRHDSSVMIVEVDNPDKAWRIDLIGQVLETHPHVRPDRSTCIRVRALLEADVRAALWLDEAGAPVMHDTPLASRSVESQQETRGVIVEMDRSRHAGRRF